MEDGQAIRDQKKGLLQLDLLGRRADRQPGSKLRVVLISETQTTA
jgi:hypothetical protein